MERDQIIEAEVVEVIDEEEAPHQPLEVRVVLHQGTPVEVSFDNLRPEDYREWINQSLFDVNTGQLLSGVFLGTAFIPMDKIKFFEQII